MFQSLKKDRYAQLLLILIIIYISYFSVFTILRHKHLQSNYYDLGIMDQTVYNTYRGRLLELTDPTGSNTIKRMAIHNDVLLAFLAPFYAIHTGPETLLVIQTVVLALGAIPLYLLAKKILKHKALAFVLAFSYLMYPALQRSNIYEFHAVTLATSLLLYMFYFWYGKKYAFSFIFFILALFSKEQVGLTTALFAAFAFFQKRYDKQNIFFATTIFALSILWFALSFWVIIPHFRTADHFAVSRYKDFGDNSTGIIKGIITRPQLSISRIISVDTLQYLFLLTSPLLAVSFFSPLHLLIALPDFLINILSSEPNMKNIIHHYTAVITPFVFISAVYGVKRLHEKYPTITYRTIAVGIIIATMCMSYLKSPVPYSLEKNIGPFVDNPKFLHDISAWKQTLRDENIKVAATDTLAAQFADRKTIMRFSQYYPTADYIVLSRYQIFNDWLDWYNSPRIYTDLKNDTRFKIKYKNGDLEVYKKI